MKRLYTFLFLIFCSLSLCAQNEEKFIMLDEVIVKAAMVVYSVDGQIIYPTEALRNASNNGYSIMQKLALPNIRVDNIAHSISAIDNRGDVQIRKGIKTKCVMSKNGSV